MRFTSRLLKTIPVFLACSAITASGETLFTSGFDANTGATVLAGNTDNATVTSSTLTITDWVKHTSVTNISGLTAISTDNGVFIAGGFAQLQNGAATYANANNVYLSRNSFTVGTDPRNRGFSMTFTLDTPWDLDSLTVLSGHTTNAGIQDQAFASDLVFNLSGGTLGSPVTATSTENYANAPAYHTVPFDLTGTTLGAGTYTLQVYQTAATGGSYAMFDGITLTAVLPAELKVVSSGFNAGAFEVQATGLDTAKQYVLKRSETLADGFPIQIGAAVTPVTNTHTFSDPAPAGAKAFYRVEEAP